MKCRRSRSHAGIHDTYDIDRTLGKRVSTIGVAPSSSQTALEAKLGAGAKCPFCGFARC